MVLRLRIPLMHDRRVVFLLEGMCVMITSSFTLPLYTAARTRAIHKRIPIDSWDSLVECAIQLMAVATKMQARQKNTSAIEA